jgi:multiple sugar transport system permease protein
MANSDAAASPSFARSTWIRLLVLTLAALIVLFPLFVVVLASFWPPGAAIAHWTPPTIWTLASYREAWERGDFWLAFANSTIVAVAVTALQLFTSALAGYGLARLQFPGRRALLAIALATLVIPFQVLVIPLFLILKAGHLINTYGALILPTAASGFGILLMRQTFLTLPLELEEAAALDGANRWQILTQILLPLTRPAWITLGLFAFIGEWNDLFKALVFTTRPNLKTVQLSLASLQEQFTNNWPVMMAAIILSSLPILMLFLWGQRFLVRGVATTGIRG